MSKQETFASLISGKRSTQQPINKEIHKDGNMESSTASDEMFKSTFIIRKDIHQKLKLYAASRSTKTNMAEVVERAVIAYMRDNP